MKLYQLDKRHEDEELWVCGCGPSLDEVDWREAGPVRICVNRAVSVVPSPSFYASIDGDAARKIDPPLGCVIVMANGFRGQVRSESYVVFVKCPQTTPSTDRGHVGRVGELSATFGSGCLAIHLAWYLGAASVVLAGFDGRGKYAPSIREKYPNAVPAPGDGYARSRVHMIDALKILDVPWRDAVPV